MSARPPKVAAVILAGGHSRRMAPLNKLLVMWEGKPLVAHAVEAALASLAAPVIVVTGYQADLVAEALADHAGEFMSAHNPDHAAGMSASLRTGLDALPDDIDGALVMLGDMPRITPGLLDRLIEAFDGQKIVVPFCAGRRGNPVLWPRRYLEAVKEELQGDRGARNFLLRRGRAMVKIEADDSVLSDFDIPEDLEGK